MEPHYEDESIVAYLGKTEEVLCALDVSGPHRVTHLITDPPYSPHVHKNHTTMKGGASKKAPIPFGAMTEVAREALAYYAATHVARWTLVFSDVESSYLWRQNFVLHGLDYVRTGIWVKQNATPQLSGDRPAQAHEDILLAHPKCRKRWNGAGQHGVWTYPIVKGAARVHPAQKPLGLMRALVHQFTDEGDVVLDPYGGSGTTAVACKELGRKCIIVEENPEYMALATARFRQTELSHMRPGPQRIQQVVAF